MKAQATLLCALALILCCSAAAQNYSVDWFKIAGGGGTSTGGAFSVSGTLGQHDASGAMTGGNYSITGGFWSLIFPAGKIVQPADLALPNNLEETKS